MELTEALERLIECARFAIDAADPADVDRHMFLFDVDSTENAIEAVINYAKEHDLPNSHRLSSEGNSYSSLSLKQISEGLERFKERNKIS